MSTILDSKIIRNHTVKMAALLVEYKQLRDKLFENLPFAEPEDNEDWRRYDQLFAYFYPQYRTKNWKSPL